MQNHNILIVVAVWFLVLFELWDRSYDVRQKIYYGTKKLIRPIFIYIGGLNERERVERKIRSDKFKHSEDAERDRPTGGGSTKGREGKSGVEGTKQADRGSSSNLEIVRGQKR